MLEGRDVSQTFARAIRDPGLWRAGVAWKKSIASAPRITDAAPRDGELVYEWPASGGLAVAASSLS